MKTVPPPCPEPETGVRYWRGLDELAGTTEFKAQLEQEFPAGASELTDAASRRDFMKFMSASLALAGVGLTGCRRPEEKIYPFGSQPEGYYHGVPQYFATAMPTRSGAVPLVAKQHDGRPVKVEGNTRHPDSNGGTDAQTQASILDLYDPDRSQRFAQGGNAATRQAGLDFLANLATAVQGKQGAGLAILLGRSTSPSRANVLTALASKLPQAKVYVYESVDFDVHRQGAKLATGKAGAPYYRLENAQVLLSLDCDFLGREEDSARYARGFTKGRKANRAGETLNRLYIAEPLYTVTGANADHRSRIPASQVFPLAAAIAAQILPAGSLRSACEAVAKPAGVDAKWIQECAADLKANAGKAVVLPGYSQPLAVHALAHAINEALGAFGKTVELRDIGATAGGTLTELAEALKAGSVETLVMLGSNPVYDGPADLQWAETQRRAKTVVRLGFYEDETSAKSDWHFPAAHYLESWGDARSSDGTLVAVQPLIEPLFGGLTELEVLARLAGAAQTKPYEIVRSTFFQLAKTTSEDAWERFLYEGYLAGSAAAPVSASIDAAAVASAVTGAAKLAAPTKDSLEVVFVRDAKIDDGRFANNGWLQEFPDPITKLTWDNAVIISRKTATELGLVNGEIIDLEVGGRKLRAPIWVTPGTADNVVGLPLGYGRTKPGRVACYEGKSVGFDAGVVRASGSAWVASGAKATGTRSSHTFATTQSHWAMSGRPLVREANHAQFEKNPAFAKNFDLESHAGHIATGPDGHPLPLYKTAYEERPATQKSEINQWAMAIDLSACTGCGACVVACQSENNIPIVGKDQVIRGREMHWLRIDRYFTGYKEGQRNKLIADEDQWKETWIDDPQVVNQPMMCQHCEKAPCESVCPVNATVHDEEGLNIMAYNRCVGTRYCSNNCAWKVRRFNFFDYNKRPINYGDISEGKFGKLYQGPLATRNAAELELVKMAKNPEVTVRMRGVMEKCTFCTQRIEAAKISRKSKAGASGDVQVIDADGLKTACQQACPAEAIIFGNHLEEGSRVNQWKRSPRDYTVLGFLDTRPRITYLAKLRNPNPKMPDFREVPLSIDEYKQMYHGDPFAEGGHGHGEAAGHGGEAAHGATKSEGGH
ncbi:MAG: TAT-variant-translocated molybdopterin oxidoreductase [Verrucomicrobiales bacterium]|nr:TAT-variant-translocated molybdopterin oxidoreductase [Verrucomicrobiales bacterium]